MTGTHLTEDDLVLHYYGELSRADEAAAAAHLDACRACHAEYRQLQRVLGVLDEGAVAGPDLPPSFERTVWARLEPRLRRERRGWLSWLVFSPAPLALAAAVAVLVAAAFFAGRALSPPRPAVEPAAAAGGAEQLRERILLMDLGEHLDRSQMVLVELVSQDPSGDVDISGERTRAEQLVADNRLYRLAADEAGDVAVRQLLDDIERVLTEVAASAGRMSPEDLAAVRDRIESKDLLFKVRVVSSAVRERQLDELRRRMTPRS